MKTIVYGAESDLGINIEGAALGPIQLKNDIKTFYQDEVIEKSKGGTQPNLSMRVLEQFQVAAPTVHEQISIAACINSLDTLITLHQREVELQQNKKKALMQLLLTGKVRVKT